MKPASSDEIERWDQLVAANPDRGNVLQVRAFGQTKARHGWRDRYFNFGGAAVLVIERQIPGLGALWYVPKGPGVSELLGLRAFADELRRLDHQPFMVKIDPEILAGNIQPQDLIKTGYARAPRDLQYNTSTVIVDLEPSEDDISASLKQKTRYNIRLAEKKGVKVSAVPTDQSAIDKMYELYATTTQRAKVYLRSKQYFTDFWTLHAEQGVGQMFFAEYEGQVLAGAFITHLGTKALYKDGGSIRDHSEVQAPYALQWGIISWLKAHGVTEYDLHGTPPAAQIEDPKHPLAGLARFKTGFQPEVTEYIGTWDLHLDARSCAIWNRIGERVAVAYEYRVKKRLFY